MIERIAGDQLDMAVEGPDQAVHCTALHCTALHCTALHCTALHCTALHCTALHCYLRASPSEVTRPSQGGAAGDKNCDKPASNPNHSAEMNKLSNKSTIEHPAGSRNCGCRSVVARNKDGQSSAEAFMAR